MDPNTVLKCFDTEILYYGSKGFWGLCLYDSFTLSQNFFLTCFDIKISHLGSNPYPQLVLLPKWNLGLDLKYKIVVVIWETKRTYFCSKMLYNTHFCPKRTVWTHKRIVVEPKHSAEMLWPRNIVLRFQRFLLT